jgi:archaemetzincin
VARCAPGAAPELRRFPPRRAAPRQSGQPTLVFLPLGASTDQDRALLDAAIELAGLWFELPARVLPAEPVPAGAPSRERRFAWSSQPTAQYASWWFLEEYLPRRRPPDAVLLAAVTASDLYPAESWNYVFGEADPRRRAAVFSFLRMRPEFWGERAGAARLALRRALLLTVHELGHVFGLAHCAQFRCAMNGANSLEEWDRAPLHLCPDCLRKLQWSRGFDALERYRRLQAFFARRGLREEAGWVARRVRRLAAR